VSGWSALNPSVAGSRASIGPCSIFLCCVSGLSGRSGCLHSVHPVHFPFGSGLSRALPPFLALTASTRFHTVRRDGGLSLLS
jgi:hypothetical protein